MGRVGVVGNRTPGSAARSSVRVVLLDDTLLRVALTPKMTARDLIAEIHSHCQSTTIDQQQEEVATVELELVRSGVVLDLTQPLSDAVLDHDILEWKSVAYDAADTGPLYTEHELPETAAKGEDQDFEAHDLFGDLPKTRRLSPRQQHVRVSRCQRRRAKPWQVGAVAAKSPSAKCPASCPQTDVCKPLMPRGYLLAAGFECLERLLTLQTLIRQLALLVRDLNARLGPQPLETLFPVVQALASQSTELRRVRSTELSADPDLRSVRSLYPFMTRSIRGTEMPIVTQGFVDVAEWVALWRNQRKAFACLCDGAVLHLFATKKQCDEYVFEVVMRANERNLEPAAELDHRRFLKENSPQSTIDLVANQWNVRKGDQASDATPQRHAFALFDRQGKMRLIMDVTSQQEVDEWIQAIKQEISQTQTLRQLVANAGILGQSGRAVVVPLRWLHSHVNLVSQGLAREEKAKSWTLTQALKDARRDRLQINGVVYSGLCVEQITGALLMEITRLSPDLTPAEALQFGHLLLISSSRTQGGGDILDAIRLLFTKEECSEHYFFCPVESERMEPICIDVSEQSLGEERSIVAEIRIQMTYRVVLSSEIGESSDSCDLPGDGSKSSEGDVRVKGVYNRRLACTAKHWNQLDGTVEITIQ